jgi:hypothetical protein
LDTHGIFLKKDDDDSKLTEVQRICIEDVAMNEIDEVVEATIVLAEVVEAIIALVEVVEATITLVEVAKIITNTSS